MASGTFNGPLVLSQGTIPPTGRRVEFRLAEFYRIKSSGLVAEFRDYFYDLASVFKQVGLKA